MHHNLLIKLNAWASLKYNAGNDGCRDVLSIWDDDTVFEGSKCAWNYKAMTAGFYSCCRVKNTFCVFVSMKNDAAISLTFIYGPEGNTWHTGIKSIVKMLFQCCKAIKSDCETITQFQQKDWDWHGRMPPDNTSIFLQFFKKHSASTDLRLQISYDSSGSATLHIS